MTSISNHNSAVIELKVSCRNLVTQNALGNLFPMIMLYTKSPVNPDEWIENGRSEIVQGNFNPTFNKTFLVDYFFEDEQPLLFVVVDVKSAQTQENEYDRLGSSEILLSSIICSHGKSIVRNIYLPGSQVSGTIKVSGVEVENEHSMVSLQFQGRKLDNKGFFGKSDPFYVISYYKENGLLHEVYRSPSMPKTVEPHWAPIEINLWDLCECDRERQLKIDVYNDHNKKAPELIGSVHASLKELLLSIGEEIDIINDKKRVTKSGQASGIVLGYKNSGLLKITKAEIKRASSFLDYITGGLKLELCVAMCFAESDDEEYSDEKVLDIATSVAKIFEDYVDEKSITFFGFGARAPLNPYFLLNGNGKNHDCIGAAGLAEAFHASLPKVKKGHQRDFTALIKKISKNIIEKKNQAIAEIDEVCYTVLLILTNGSDQNITETINSIVQASVLPFSIIVVGVGSCDLQEFFNLESENGLLKNSLGETAQREIAQFVPTSDFELVTGEIVTHSVLALVPGQVMQYLNLNGIKPVASPPKKNPPKRQSFDHNKSTIILDVPDISINGISSFDTTRDSVGQTSLKVDELNPRRAGAANSRRQSMAITADLFGGISTKALLVTPKIAAHQRSHSHSILPNVFLSDSPTNVSNGSFCSDKNKEVETVTVKVIGEDAKSATSLDCALIEKIFVNLEKIESKLGKFEERNKNDNLSLKKILLHIEGISTRIEKIEEKITKIEESCKVNPAPNTSQFLVIKNNKANTALM
ncbi:hypothetical protein HDU92_003844 [Lobulomyces angularis]|nr:hypothetical protein HDU92_003844 [Lobulomyces angularis]